MFLKKARPYSAGSFPFHRKGRPLCHKNFQRSRAPRKGNCSPTRPHSARRNQTAGTAVLQQACMPPARFLNPPREQPLRPAIPAFLKSWKLLAMVQPFSYFQSGNPSGHLPLPRPSASFRFPGNRWIYEAFAGDSQGFFCRKIPFSIPDSPFFLPDSPGACRLIIPADDKYRWYSDSKSDMI